MSSSSIVLRVPMIVREKLRGLEVATPDTPSDAGVEESPGRRAPLARLADEVSPPVRGGFRHFVW